MDSYNPDQTGNYYVLGDSNTEMVHLILADQCFNKAMGGELPEQGASSLSHIYHVLDVACGPGGWALEVAQKYPHIQVTGIDISQGMIEYANVQARASGLDNATFKVADAMQSLPFPDKSFDLVNVRHVEFAIPVAIWPGLVKEMFRVTKHGGIVRLTDCEWGLSNSYAFEELQRLATQAGRMVGMSHSSDERNFGITPWLSRLLRDAGCVNIQERPSILDFSAEEEEHQNGYQLLTIAYQLIAPFLLGTQVITPQKLEHLQHQLAVELLEDESRGIIYTLTAWGTRP